MYITRITINNELQGFPHHVLPSFITNSSKKAVSFLTLEHDKLKPDLFYSKTYEVLTCKIPDLFYWQSPANLTNYDFRSSVIFSTASPRFAHKSFTLFYGQIKQPKASTSTPMVGLGMIQPNKEYLVDFSDETCEYHFYTVHKNKVLEDTDFMVLCIHQLPTLLHYCFPSIKWVDASNGQLPPHAFPISATHTKNLLYFAKAENKKKREIFFAKVAVQSGKLWYLEWPECYDQGDFTFSILTVNDPTTIEWCIFIEEDRRKISLPLNAIPICCNWNHQKSCIARKIIGNSSLTETIVAENVVYDSDVRFMAITVSDNGIASYTPLDRQAFEYSSYDLMVAKISPRSLKQLCRNAIIVTTLAIPDRVDQLSLPNFLKDYCKLNPEEKLQIPSFM